jgi:hypothetical protein
MGVRGLQESLQDCRILFRSHGSEEQYPRTKARRFSIDFDFDFDFDLLV